MSANAAGCAGVSGRLGDGVRRRRASTASGNPNTASSPCCRASCFWSLWSSGFFGRAVPHHRRDDVQQLAAGAAGLHRHRALARLRLHHLRRPAQFHLRAPALGSHRLRHPGRDADRGVAHRRELRHRHEPAHRRRAKASRRAKPSSACCSAWRWSASPSTGCSTNTAPSASRGPPACRPTGAGSPTSRSISCSRSRWSRVIAFNFRRGGDISTPYVQSVRLIAKNAVLWVMFLASMASSVFFSFDSHFNAIFSAEQRKRAAEIRTLNQVGRVVADIGERTQKAQLERGRAPVRDRRLEGLRHAARQARPAGAGVAGRDREVLRPARWKSAGAASPSSRSASPAPSAARPRCSGRRDELEAELQRVEPGVGALEAELAQGAGHLQCDQGRPSPPSASRPMPRTAASKAR